MMGKEIERRYLLGDFFPDNFQNKIEDCCLVNQFYVHLQNNDFFRIRSIVSLYNDDTICSITYKKGEGLVREEYEAEISEETFNVFSHMPKYFLSKTRYILHDEFGKKWIIDNINSFPKNILLAEIELENENEEVSIPFFIKGLIIKEVTDYIEYTNLSIAIRNGIVT